MKTKSKKSKQNKFDLMFPDLTQIKLEKAQLDAHRKTTKHIENILKVLLILANKINNIEGIILKNKKGENINGKK